MGALPAHEHDGRHRAPRRGAAREPAARARRPLEPAHRRPRPGPRRRARRRPGRRGSTPGSTTPRSAPTASTTSTPTTPASPPSSSASSTTRPDRAPHLGGIVSGRAAARKRDGCPAGSAQARSWRAWSTSRSSCATEGLDAVELALAAQEVREADLGLLAVEVAVEVEQVGLEQRVVGVLVERRPAAEVDGARVHGRRRAARTTRRRRRRPAGRRAFGTSTLAVGKPSRRPRWSPSTTGPRASYGRPSMRRGQLDVAAGERAADGGAADRLVDAVGPRRRAAPGRPRSRASRRLRAAGRRCPRDGCRSGSPRRPRRRCTARHSTAPARRTTPATPAPAPRRSGSTTVASMPVCGQQLEPLLEIGEQLRRRLGPDDRGRVAVEGERRRSGRRRSAAMRPHLGDHRLVAEVDAVVGADRDDGALARPRCRVDAR